MKELFIICPDKVVNIVGQCMIEKEEQARFETKFKYAVDTKNKNLFLNILEKYDIEVSVILFKKYKKKTYFVQGEDLYDFMEDIENKNPGLAGDPNISDKEKASALVAFCLMDDNIMSSDIHFVGLEDKNNKEEE